MLSILSFTEISLVIRTGWLAVGAKAELFARIYKGHTASRQLGTWGWWLKAEVLRYSPNVGVLEERRTGTYTPTLTDQLLSMPLQH